MKRAPLLILAALASTALAFSTPPAALAEGPVGRFTLAGSGIELVFIPGGEFSMGSTGGRANEAPSHRVHVDSFYLGIFEVTQRQWEEVMGENPSHFAGCADCPVEQVSWEDAREFLRRAGKIGGVEVRLPTEAEWEYAAGGGPLHQEWPGTGNSSETGEFSWFSGVFAGKTRPVGLKLPNAFGLYDMGGNVWEWCADWYGRDYYASSPGANPSGPSAGVKRVVRGGSWLTGPTDTRVAHRSMRNPARQSRTVGFRAAAAANSVPSGNAR